MPGFDDDDLDRDDSKLPHIARSANISFKLPMRSRVTWLISAGGLLVLLASALLCNGYSIGLAVLSGDPARHFWRADRVYSRER
jgi:hypothetical protein